MNKGSRTGGRGKVEPRSGYDDMAKWHKSEMLNSSTRRETIRALEVAVAEHEELRQRTTAASTDLFDQRRRAADEVIVRVEDYVNRLAHSPKEFDKSIENYRVEVGRFNDHVQHLEVEAARSAKVGSVTGTAGALAGVGVAALGPSAALAVASTFGTASTGTAISTLSGAAAANAALAWLGGGAMAAGGGGVAAGNVLLALAGPVGWTVAGVSLVGAAAYLRSRNAKYAREATQRRIEVEAEIRSLRVAESEIARIATIIRRHADGCLADLDWLGANAPGDYREFADPHKERLATLVNHIESLGVLLKSQVAYGQS